MRLEPAVIPCRCGHVREWHRTRSGACTHEVRLLPAVIAQLAAEGKRRAWGPCSCNGYVARTGFVL